MSELLQKREFSYKGYWVEIGELPGPRKSYWSVTGSLINNPLPKELTGIHEVECGSWQDLEIIAKRSIDGQAKRQQEQEENS